MPKKKTDFPEHINLLLLEGTTELLVAISFFRGEAGSYAGPARDYIFQGVQRFKSGLSDADRKRFEQILANVQTRRSFQE